MLPPLPPLPLPPLTLLAGLKVAVTDAATSNLTEQVAVVPEHAPDQPLKTDDAAGNAVNTMDVPEA